MLRGAQSVEGRCEALHCSNNTFATLNVPFVCLQTHAARQQGSCVFGGGPYTDLLLDVHYRKQGKVVKVLVFLPLLVMQEFLHRDLVVTLTDLW